MSWEQHVETRQQHFAAFQMMPWLSSNGRLNMPLSMMLAGSTSVGKQRTPISPSCLWPFTGIKRKAAGGRYRSSHSSAAPCQVHAFARRAAAARVTEALS